MVMTWKKRRVEVTGARDCPREVEGRCEEVGLEAQENSLEKLSSGVRKDDEESICREKWGQSHFILHKGAICPYHSTEARETVGRTRLKMGNKGVSLFHAGQ